MITLLFFLRGEIFSGEKKIEKERKKEKKSETESERENVRVSAEMTIKTTFSSQTIFLLSHFFLSPPFSFHYFSLLSASSTSYVGVVAQQSTTTYRPTT